MAGRDDSQDADTFVTRCQKAGGGGRGRERRGGGGVGGGRRAFVAKSTTTVWRHRTFPPPDVYALPEIAIANLYFLINPPIVGIDR